MRYITLHLALALALAACQPTRKTPADTLVVAISTEPATLDPKLATDAYGMRIASLLYASLVRLGPELKAVPYAAESWTIKDHRYDFLLRPLKFSDGRAVTRDDVQFSFAQFLKPHGVFTSMLDDIVTVKVEERASRLHVLIDVKRINDRLLTTDLPVIKILPKDGRPVYSGPFALKGADANAIELTRVGGGTGVIFKVIRDGFTRYQKMQKGELDIAQMEIAPLKWHEFSAPKFQTFKYPGLSVAYMLINFRDPRLRELKVRQALFAALNREEFIKYKLYGLASPASSLLTPNNPEFLPGLTPAKITADLHGLKFTIKTSNTPEAIDNGKVLAHQLARTGAEVEVQSYEWGTFYNDVKHGNFQLATMRWVGTVDPELYRMAFHSKEFPPGRNRGFYKNPELDRILDQADLSEDQKVRRKLFARAQKLVYDDLAIIPLWYDQQIAVASPAVINYHPNQTGDYWPLVEAAKKHE